MSEPIKSYKLAHPIQHGSETITELVVEARPKAKAFKGIPADGIMLDHMFLLLGRITAQPPSVIEELDSEDLFGAVGMVNDFLPNSLATGDSQ